MTMTSAQQARSDRIDRGCRRIFVTIVIVVVTVVALALTGVHLPYHGTGHATYTAPVPACWDHGDHYLRLANGEFC